MDLVKGRGCDQFSIQSDQEEDQMDLRRGPWTMEEDFTLINYIALHGEGRWNSAARSAGLKRTGKSCRLRWLNYLRPDVRRGNITLEEQLLILELHSRWGNRWSKIAQHLPGRTDNEIKNYWRTRVQKHAKQLKCDVNSKQFKDTMRYLWMPRLVERIQAAAATNGSSSTTTSNTTVTVTNDYKYCNNNNYNDHTNIETGLGQAVLPFVNIGPPCNAIFTPDNSSTGASSDSIGIHVSPTSDLTDCYNYAINKSNNQDYFSANYNQLTYGECLTSPAGYFNPGLDFQSVEPNSQWMDSGDLFDSLWNVEDILFSQ